MIGIIKFRHPIPTSAHSLCYMLPNSNFVYSTNFGGIFKKWWMGVSPSKFLFKFHSNGDVTVSSTYDSNK